MRCIFLLLIIKNIILIILYLNLFTSKIRLFFRIINLTKNINVIHIYLGVYLVKGKIIIMYLIGILKSMLILMSLIIENRKFILFKNLDILLILYKIIIWIMIRSCLILK